ncbi:MAG: transporter, family, proline/betaine transporter [Acetobacteraceae bacterium]|jgi:MHS family proline/betaine transporter-like MFS transporter|nr:transporter, family, proline/betaine transporter [Acetobacteraceae bacterium]
MSQTVGLDLAIPEGRNDVMLRRAILSCAVGQVFEIYDFVIYGFMAGAIARTFFPAFDPIAALLSTFATFAVGFLFRPLGAVIIGSFGDRFGRRQALVVTIGMMALATGLIGLIPGYATIGIAAPIILVLCRAFQGFSTGGEWGGAATFLVEYAPPRRRGFISSFQQSGTALGLLLGTFVAALLNYNLSPESFQAWGWRIPFLIGFVLGPIGHYLRTHVAETPAYAQTIAARTVVRSPLREAFAAHKGTMLLAFVISINSCVVYWLFLVYLPTFAQQQLHLTASAALFSTAVAGLIYLFLTPFVGGLSDRVGRKPLLYASFVGTVVLGYPLFALLVSWHSVAGLFLVQAVATLCLTFNSGVACAVLAELFPTRIRYSALSISYGLSVAIFGGFAALIATALIRVTGDPLSPAYYVVAGGVASLIATFFMAEGAKRPLPD